MAYPANSYTNVGIGMQPVWTRSVIGDPLVFDLQTIKGFLKIALEDTIWDDELTRFIKVAQNTIEQYCQLNLTLSNYLGRFWTLDPGITVLNQRPFISVIGITYLDMATGSILGVDPTTYLATQTSQLRGAIMNAQNNIWPTWAQRPDAVTVTLQAGYDPQVNPMPDDVSNALLMTIGSLWTKRGDESGGGGGHATVFAARHPGMMGRGNLVIPAEAKALLGPYTFRHI